MQRILTTTALIALAASAATADGVNYGRLGYDVSNFSSDTGDADVSRLQGSVEYEMGRFVLGGELANVDLSGDLVDADISQIGLSAGYIVSPQILAGLGYISIDSGAVENDGFELFGQYEDAPYGVAINVADLDSGTTTRAYGQYALNNTTELGVILTSVEDVDGTGYRFSGDYTAGRIDARGYLAGNTDVDGTTLGLRGAYDLGNSFRGLGGFATNNGGALDSSSFYLGAGYEIVDGAWIDASYGRVEFEGTNDIDRLRIVATFEMGQRRRLDRDMDQDVIDDRLASFASLGF